MNPLTTLTISPQILRILSELDEFKGQWKALERLPPSRLSSLQKVATIESIGSSTRIEGSKLSNQEIEDLLSGIGVSSFSTQDEQEVAGYAAVMDLVFDGFREITLTENHIKQLHALLLKHSEKDARHRGHYKKLPNDVVAKNASGEVVGVVFETATPFDTPQAMEVLTQWASSELDKNPVQHPLLVIAAFIVRFLAIHPFQDGNGRLSRILTTLFMLRAGYRYVQYSSHEQVIEVNKSGYYKSLRLAQQTLDGDESQLDAWVMFFLETLLAQKKTLMSKLKDIKAMDCLPPLSEQIFEIVKAHGRVTTSEAVKLTGANARTIKKHLADLVRSGHLARQGQGRGTWYSL